MAGVIFYSFSSFKSVMFWSLKNTIFKISKCNHNYFWTLHFSSAEFDLQSIFLSIFASPLELSIQDFVVLELLPKWFVEPMVSQLMSKGHAKDFVTLHFSWLAVESSFQMWKMSKAVLSVTPSWFDWWSEIPKGIHGIHECLPRVDFELMCHVGSSHGFDLFTIFQLTLIIKSMWSGIFHEGQKYFSRLTYSIRNIFCS